MVKDNNFLNKYPKLATLITSLIVVVIFFALLIYVVRLDLFQDGPDQEKYSAYDKIIYAIRCDNRRNIKLREATPNQDRLIYPEGKHATLEDKGYRFRVNHDGIIEPAFIHKNPDLQIFFLGGSTTECNTVDEEFRFPYLAGRNLEKSLKIKVNSDNASRSGNNSLHSINILINKLLPYKPDIVVMMHNVNDLSTLMHEGSYWNKNKTISPISCSYKNRQSYSRDDQWQNSAWHDKVINDKKEQDNLVLDFKSNLELFIKICKTKNIIPVLMTQPNRIVANDDFVSGRGKEFDVVYRNLYKKFSQTIKDVGKKENVLVIDLESKVPSEEKYIHDPVHVNKEGSIMEADEISKRLSVYLKNIRHESLTINH